MFNMESKMTHFSATFVESLVAGDKVAISQHEHSNGFVYSDEGGGILTFKGELIAE